MIIYLPIIIKLGLGILCLIVQINLMGKGNLAPSSAMDQVQNYVLGGMIDFIILNRNDDHEIIFFNDGIKPLAPIGSQNPVFL